MLCEVCNQHEAVLHLTQVVNKEVKKIHLCETCAAEKGLDLNDSLSLTDVLLGLTGKKESTTALMEKSCPFCHMRFADFKKTSRLGCQACYEAFAEVLDPLIEAMHRGKQHTGKIPVKSLDNTGDVLAGLSLKKALEAAVTAENYEEAARLRDQLHECMTKKGKRKPCKR